MAETYNAFRQALSERGWVEGRNLILDFRYADNRYDRLPALAAELVALKPDVIFAVAAPAIRAVAQTTSTIPIVIERPTKFELIINLRTAKALGLTIPPSILLQANDVIQ